LLHIFIRECHHCQMSSCMTRAKEFIVASLACARILAMCLSRGFYLVHPYQIEWNTHPIYGPFNLIYFLHRGHSDGSRCHRAWSYIGTCGLIGTQNQGIAIDLGNEVAVMNHACCSCDVPKHVMLFLLFSYPFVG
jgi:hypothetical protein